MWNKSHISACSFQGKVTLGDLDLDDVSGPMDIATIQNIKMLQEKLAAILRPATK